MKNENTDQCDQNKGLMSSEETTNSSSYITTVSSISKQFHTIYSYSNQLLTQYFFFFFFNVMLQVSHELQKCFLIDRVFGLYFYLLCLYPDYAYLLNSIP